MELNDMIVEMRDGSRNFASSDLLLKAQSFDFPKFPTVWCTCDRLIAANDNFWLASWNLAAWVLFIRADPSIELEIVGYSRKPSASVS